MSGFVYYSLLALGFWLLWLTYSYVRNVATLRKTGFPIVRVPFIVQNHLLWMVFGPMSRLRLKRYLPEFIFNKVALGIYGVEHHQRYITFKNYVEPLMHSNPELLGNGKTYALATSGRLEIWSYDPEFAKEVYCRPNDFRQFDIANDLLSIFGDNVLSTNGGEWSRHRRIVAGAVTERVSSVVWNESVRQARDLLTLVTRSSNSTDDGQAQSGTTYRMFDLIKQIALHVLFAAGMGKTQDLDTPSTSKPLEKLPPDVHLSYFETVRLICEGMAGPLLLPNVILRNWPSFLPGTEYAHSLNQAKVEFPKHTRSNLAYERDTASSLSEPRNNVLSALLAASERNADDPEANTKNARKGPALTDMEIVGNLFIFSTAGFDTTANTLAYAMIFLARYPKWQSWLIEELDSILPPYVDPTQVPTYDYKTIFTRSQRAMCIMYETLRLFPPLNHLCKMTEAPQTITLSNNITTTIPAKTTVYVNFIELHTDPSVWRNLNMTPLERKSAADDEDNVLEDEHIFRPSRWINPDGSLYKPAPGTYLPWSAGPRVCPGQKMAQVEFVAILSTLFSRHRLEAVRGTKKVKGGDETVEIPESDDALGKRLDAVMEASQPKLTLEMDVFNISEKEARPGGRAVGLTWVARK